MDGIVSQGSRQSGIFDTPSNKGGLITKQTKIAAQEVDEQLINDQELMARILEEEKEECPPDLTIDQWNEMYLEVQYELNSMLAQQLVEDHKFDDEADYELNQMFSELAIEQQAETLDPTNNDSGVCPMCKGNVARRVQGSRIVCELQGCLDINCHFDDFRVEEIMIKLNQIVDEHKRHT